jgi:hypothetical protein
VRRDYLVHATQRNATLDVVYILSNEKGAWIDGLKKMLQKDGWTVAASQDLVLNAEQKDVGMAVDMEIARRATGFVGNGVSLSSLARSQIVFPHVRDQLVCINEECRVPAAPRQTRSTLPPFASHRAIGTVGRGGSFGTGHAAFQRLLRGFGISDGCTTHESERACGLLRGVDGRIQ